MLFKEYLNEQKKINPNKDEYDIQTEFVINKSKKFNKTNIDKFDASNKFYNWKDPYEDISKELFWTNKNEVSDYLRNSIENPDAETSSTYRHFKKIWLSNSEIETLLYAESGRMHVNSIELDNIYKKLPKTKNIVYRWINVNNIELWKIWETINMWDAFQWSLNKKISENFTKWNWKQWILFKINWDNAWLTLNVAEEEILIPSNRKYIIKNIKNEWDYQLVELDIDNTNSISKPLYNKENAKEIKTNWDRWLEDFMKSTKGIKYNF